MLLNNNSLIMQWNRDENGNPMSWHIPLEVQQISPTHGVIQLVQVPDQHQRIKIVTEENIQLTEVFNIEDIVLDSFYVDYGVGIVRFHESQHGKLVKVDYYGRGVILISDSRIFHRDGENVADTWDNILDRSKDALDLIESAGGLVEAMEKIDEKIEQGNATADRLENFITETQFYGYTITLSREAFVVKAKEDGEVGKTEIQSIFTDIIVYQGAKQIVPTLSIEQEYGCSFKVEGQRVKLTSMDINVIKASAVLNIDCGDGLVAQRKLEVTKVFDGVSQYSVEMTNPFYSFEANSAGAIEEEKTITCNITVTKANVDYTNYSISVQNAPRGLKYNIGASSVDFTCALGSALPSSGSCLVVVTIDGASFNKTFTWNKTRKGEDAKSLVLIGGQIIRYETPDYSDVPSPHRSTVTAKTVGLSGTPKWYVKTDSTWNLLEGQNGTELTFLYNDITIWGNRKETTVKCELEGYEDELTLVKLATGGNGADAITVILTNESHTVAIDNSGYVHESEIAKTTTQVLAYQGIEEVTPILSKGACDGCDVTIDGNMVKLRSLDNSFSTATAIINVNVNGVVVPKTWTISKAKQGTDGATGENGSSYILNVTDGTRSFTYSQINLDPRPSVSATFVGTLYENGTEITEGVSYYWIANGHLQGSSIKKTFTPVISKVFDESILNNDIQLTVTYKGNTVVQSVPISVTKDANGLDWVQEWDDTKTDVRGNLILTPKIFAGSYDQDNDLITGVAVGKDVLNDGNTIGVAGYQNNKTTFLLDTDGTLMVGNPFEQDSTGLYFDGQNFTLKVNELSIEGANVATSDELVTKVDEAVNSAKEEVRAEIVDVMNQVNDLDSYMNGALSDGILDNVEKQNLRILYDALASEVTDVLAQYESIVSNAYLRNEIIVATLEQCHEAYMTHHYNMGELINTIVESEVLDGEVIAAFKEEINNFKEASAELHRVFNDALVDIGENQANEIVANAKLEVKQEIDDVSNALNSLETTMNGDFKSGLISTMNLTTLKSKLSQLETEKSDIDGQYKGIVENPKLGTTSRNNLVNAKGELDTAHDQLIIKINTAIADLLMTEAELAEINRLIAVYGQKLKAYSEIAQQANADIALNLAQGAIQALNQEDIFNKLTNNGEVQGLYLQDGKVYINGEYINSRNLKAVRNDGTETFKIDSEGNVHIRANSFHLVGDSIDTNLADKDYVDSAIESVATGSVNVMLSNEAQVIATSNNRVPFSSQTFSTKVGIYMGSTEVRDFTIGNVSSANGISVTVDQSAKTVKFAVSTDTALTADNGSFTIPVSFNGNTYNKKWTWAVSKQGNTGATGGNGADAQYVTVTGEQVFKYTNNFTGTPTPENIKIQANAYGFTNPNYIWEFKRGGETTWNPITSATDNNQNYYTLPHDNNTIFNSSSVKTVTIRCKVGSKYDEITIAKISDGANGTKGDNAKSVRITTNTQVFKSTDGGQTFSPSSIILTPHCQNVSYSSWKYNVTGGTSSSDWVSVVSGQKGLTISNGALTISKSSELFTNSVTSVSFKVYTSDSSVTDTMTISRLYDVTDLEIGATNLMTDSTGNLGSFSTGNIVDGYMGNKAYRVRRATTGNSARQQIQKDVVLPSLNTHDSYTLSGWIFIDEDVSLNADNNQLYLRCYRVGGDNYVDVCASNITRNSPRGQWFRVEKTSKLGATDIDINRCKVSMALGDAGSIRFSMIKLEKGNKATSWTPAAEDVNQQLSSIKTDLQTQVDGKIDTWSQETPDPASSWTTSDEKLKHKGDIWYKPTSKETYRYTGTSWERLYDKVAENATNIANQKRRVFVSTPTTPYDVGDLWINNEELYRCKTALSSGNYNSGHWVKAVKYTDDSVAQSAKNDLQAFKNLDEWLVINNELDTYFPFDNNLQTTGGANPNSGYNAYLNPQGKFGNCLSVQEDVVNLFAFNSISMLNVQGNGDTFTTTKMSDEEVVCKYKPSSSTGLAYRGKDIAVDTQRTYTLSGWMYVSENYNSTSAPAIRGEQGFGKLMTYDMNKKGQWQFFSHTMKPSSETARILLYPRTSSSVDNATTGYVLYKNVQFTQTGAVHMFYNGTKPKDTISYEVSQPDVSTMMAYKKHVLDSNFRHQALVKNGSTFTFYENGVATTDYVNKWRVYACEGITTPNTDGKTIDKYNKPLSTRLTTDLAGIGHSWQATGYGYVYRTFLYCSEAKTVTLMINFDNAGCAYCNGVLAGQGGYNASGNACVFNLVKGWNCIELASVDADTGGSLKYVASGSDGLFSNKTSHPEILYMTAELPIEMANNKVTYFSRANCYIDEAVFLNKTITQEEVKTYVGSGKRLTDPATIIDVPEPTNVTFSFS